MNHLGDTNKMVDTPRTDAHIDGLRRDPEVSGCDRTLDFCRQLERELNEANQIIRQQQLLQEENLRLTAKVAQLYEGAEEQKLRIKRLEEAGDRMEKLMPDGSICDKAANAWREAMEAKP